MRCDIKNRKTMLRCENKAYKEIYWNKGIWSYACRKHFDEIKANKTFYNKEGKRLSLYGWGDIGRDAKTVRFREKRGGEETIVKEKLDKINKKIKKGKRRLLSSREALGVYAKYVKR